MGMRPLDFWELTYSEFIAMYRGFIRVQRHRVNEMLSGAWHVALFSRQPKLPSLQSVMLPDDPFRAQPATAQAKQTPEQMLAMARILNAAYGGDVVEA